VIEASYQHRAGRAGVQAGPRRRPAAGAAGVRTGGRSGVSAPGRAWCGVPCSRRASAPPPRAVRAPGAAAPRHRPATARPEKERERPCSLQPRRTHWVTAEQWIKEGKNAVKWTKLSCRRFKDNEARLQLFALAYNLANALRQLALRRSIRSWTLTTLREKLVKIGAKVVSHSKYVIFQLAEVAVPRQPF